MHWWPHDAGTWGLVISLGALFLTFPLSLLANLLTPALRNWLAERSFTALRRRIKQLEKKSLELALKPLMTDGEDAIMRMVAALGIGVSQLLGTSTILLAILITYGRGEPSKEIKDILSTTAGVITLFSIATTASIMSTRMEFMRERSKGYREWLRKEIDRLKAKVGGNRVAGNKVPVKK